MTTSTKLLELRSYYKAQSLTASLIEDRVFDIAVAKLCNSGVLMTFHSATDESRNTLRQLWSARRCSRQLSWSVRYDVDRRLKAAQDAYKAAIEQMQSINGVVLRVITPMSINRLERVVYYSGIGWNRLVNMLDTAVIGIGHNCGRFIKVQTTSGVYVVSDGAHNIYSMIEDV